MSQVLRFFRTIGIFVLWSACSVLVLRSYWREGDRATERHYAADDTTSIAIVLALMAAEMAGFYYLARPWSSKPRAKGIGTGLVAFVLWTLVSMFGTMHASNAVYLHWMWLWVVDFALVVSLVVERRTPAASKS
jgi:hypothetical protein